MKGNDLRLLLYLFIGLRVVLLMVYQPQILDSGTERGLTLLGDFREHYEIAQYEGLPYRDYWVEFPPVWIGLTRLLPVANFTNWASLMIVIMLAFDTGNLILVQKIGTQLHGEEIGFRLAWIYAVLAAPFIMLAWNFEVMVLFSMLVGFWWWVSAPRMNSVAGIFIAFGALTKYLPLLLLPMIWRFASRRQAMIMTLITLGLTLAILIPFILWGGKMTVTSLTIQANKPSYQTVWALIDGNYGTGSFPRGAIRYDSTPDILAGRNPAVIPAWLRLMPFAILGGWVFHRPMPALPQTQFAFFTLTVILFMLWSQGWSPQWMVLLAPLILLNLPTRTGVLLVLALTVGAFVEYPLLFRYSVNNLISEAHRPLFGSLILARTVALGGFSFFLIKEKLA